MILLQNPYAVYTKKRDERLSPCLVFSLQKLIFCLQKTAATADTQEQRREYNCYNRH